MQYVPSLNRYTRIPYNKCGKWGLKLPALSLGLSNNFGEDSIFENSRTLIRSAFDQGITHFDLSNHYGPPPGSAEENLGKIIQLDLNSHRDELLISTKAGGRMWDGPYGESGSRKSLIASIDQSLKRLKINYVDIFYSELPDRDTPLEETMNALNQIVKQGKALYVGLANYPAELTLAASRILKELGTPCLIHQPNYSMMVRWAEDGLLNVLEQEGIGCMAASPLANGLLTDQFLNGITDGSDISKLLGFIKPEQIGSVIEKMKKLNVIAEQRGQTLAQMAVVWLMKDPRVCSVLLEASSVKMLNESISALQNTQFSDFEINLIEKIVSNERITFTKIEPHFLPPVAITKPEPISDRSIFIKNLAKKLSSY